ncbi:hypothetical protein GCM10010326_39510 [Streptomyces xanthochromogenes]|uniref:Uncharacterized protein n=1 Tax=Streptomyces xanthochromogenes TaxID=67384 RepID=A0ABQ3A9A4_9ACTN|nr:hypothetical protein GCM10010326_39510 [Streptomyces xanthochromogenes]
MVRPVGRRAIADNGEARAEEPRKRCGGVREVRDGRLGGVSDRESTRTTGEKGTCTGARARKGRRFSTCGKEDRSPISGKTACSS